MLKMTSQSERIPDGPTETLTTGEDLLPWLGDQFERFGDVFKASIYGSSIYAVRDPEYAEHVLRKNWQNYVKGQAIKRVAFLLGSGLMVSEGALWKRQRRMSQPAFHHDAITALLDLIIDTNAELMHKWECAARVNEKVDVTTDVSQTILKIVL
jgi:cytochrome P450